MSKEDKYPVEIFKDHEIKVLTDVPGTQVYLFRNPKKSEYWFRLVCSDNLIAMTGDCGSLFVEPGYGRSGIGFLRGSVDSIGYFLSKVPHEARHTLSEYKRQYAVNDLKEWVAHEYITAEEYKKFLERLGDEDGDYGQTKYQELCYELGFEEPPNATRMTSRTQLQLAGLQVFVEKFEELEKQLEIDTAATAGA